MLTNANKLGSQQTCSQRSKNKMFKCKIKCLNLDFHNIRGESCCPLYLTIPQVNISAADWLVVTSCTWWMPAAPPTSGPGRQPGSMSSCVLGTKTKKKKKRKKDKKKRVQGRGMFHPEVGPWQMKWVWDTVFLSEHFSEWKHCSAMLLLHL